MIRIIHYSNESGSHEGVFFTEDLEMDAEDVLPPNCTISSDTKLDIELPSSFPMEYNLTRD